MPRSASRLVGHGRWLEIRWNNRTGYHWGGIICPIGVEVPGTFQVCN